METNRMVRHCAAAMLFLLLIAGGVGDAAAFPKLIRKPKKDPSQLALQEYLVRARALAAPAPATLGSLWASDGKFALLAVDQKARRVGDHIIIQLAESTTSQQQGSLQTARTFAASSGISAFFGTPGPTSGI